MRIKYKPLRMLTGAAISLPIVAIVAFGPASANVGALSTDFDPGATYASKCTTCHGKTAEKHFDATKTDDALADVVMKGKDAKPLKMPSYEAKGVTADQAKALVAFMRTLHPS